MSADRIPILDSLRAFAALSVCIFHFVCTTTGYIQNETILEVFSVGKYGVQLFFVISGFVIPWSMYKGGYVLKNFFLFFLKRLARLEPPYVISVLLAVTLIYMRRFYASSPSYLQEMLSAKHVALHFFYLIPFTESYSWLNPVYWTLAVEFQYYFLIALIYPLIISSRFARYAFCIASMALSYTTTGEFLPFWLPIFVLGIFLFFYKVQLVSRTEFLCTLAILTLFCFWKYPVPAVVYALIPVAAVLFYEHKKNALLDALGKWSYSIYLVHPLAGATLINVLSHKFTAPYQKFLVICLGIIFTLIGAWLMYRLVEKPSKKFSASLKYKP